MDRARSRMLKNLIDTTDEKRAKKLDFLIRSIAQKPINVIESDG